MAVRKSKLLLKVVVALVVVTALGFAFVRSARQSRATPYKVDRTALRGWQVSVESAAGPNTPVVALRGSPELSRVLFNQIFARSMESLVSPAQDGIPLVTSQELRQAFAGRVEPAALAAIASDSGLATVELKPRCLGYRRASDRSGARQVYFVVFDLPQFTRFRDQIAALSLPGSFDPAALSPAMIIAATDWSVDSWRPLRADPAVDCVAPIATD